MKRSILLLLVCVMGLSFQANAQDFEGVIYYEIPEMTKQGMGEMPYMIKGSKIRMEFGEGMQKGALLFMPDESKMAYILDAMKGFMMMDLKNQFTEKSTTDKTSVEQTGTMKTIAGKQCEVWTITTEDNVVEACMAKGLGTFMMPQNPMAQANTPNWARELIEGGAMPLEVVQIEDDKQSVQMRATKIEERSLSAGLFEIPSGYNDMSGMMKQMMNRNQ